MCVCTEKKQTNETEPERPSFSRMNLKLIYLLKCSSYPKQPFPKFSPPRIIRIIKEGAGEMVFNQWVETSLELHIRYLH